MRPKDQKRVVTEKIIRYGSPEQRAFHTVQRQTRKHRGGQEAARGRETGESFYCGFPGKARTKWGEQLE